MVGTPDNSRCHVFVVRVLDEDTVYVTHKSGIRGKKQVEKYMKEVLARYPRAEHFRIYNETLTKTTWKRRAKAKS